MTAKTSAPLTQQQAYALVDAISENEQLTLAASAFEDENGDWVFEATCQTEPNLIEFAKIASNILGGNVSFTSEKIDPDIDWIAKSLEGLPAVNAGGFFIHAGHNKAQVPDGVIPLHIEAAQAFGTGHHETTSGCLQAIYGILKKSRPRRALDVGTGTGVLAIALSKRLRQPIIASDIDPVAVKTTNDNALLNNVSEWVEAIEATGLNHPRIANHGPYDLIVANILAGPLAKLAPDISAAATNGAYVILSGILNAQANEVITTYAQHNITLNNRIVLNEWTTLVLNKV